MALNLGDTSGSGGSLPLEVTAGPEKWSGQVTLPVWILTSDPVPVRPLHCPPPLTPHPHPGLGWKMSHLGK